MNMFVVLFILFSFFTAQAHQYESIQFESCPDQECRYLLETFKKYGYEAINGEAGLPDIGINYLLFDENNKAYLTLKAGVKGDFELERTYDLDKGSIVHFKMSEKIFALYINGVSRKYRDDLFQKVLKSAKSFRVSSILEKLNPITSAYSSACDENLTPLGADTISAFEGISVAMITDGLINCLKSMASGAGDSVTSIPKALQNGWNAVSTEAKTFWDNPNGRLNDYYQAVDGAVSKFTSGLQMIAECLINPSKGLAVLKEQLGEVGEYLGQIVMAARAMPLEAGLDFICSFMGGLGVDAVIAAITGVGVAKFALTFKRAASVAMTLSRLMKNIGKYGADKLGLDKVTQVKLFKAVRSEKLDERKVEVLAEAVELESDLARKFALRGLQCSL